MRLPTRGVLIRLCIYVPLIGFLGWRAMHSRCGPQSAHMAEEPKLEDEFAPYRKTLTLPDGTQREIVELTPEQAEAILGHPLPRDHDDAKSKAQPSGEGEPTTGPADAKSTAPGADPAR